MPPHSMQSDFNVNTLILVSRETEANCKPSSVFHLKME